MNLNETHCTDMYILTQFQYPMFIIYIDFVSLQPSSNLSTQCSFFLLMHPFCCCCNFYRDVNYADNSLPCRAKLQICFGFVPALSIFNAVAKTSKHCKLSSTFSVALYVSDEWYRIEESPDRWCEVAEDIGELCLITIIHPALNQQLCRVKMTLMIVRTERDK